MVRTRINLTESLEGKLASLKRWRTQQGMEKRRGHPSPIPCENMPSHLGKTAVPDWPHLEAEWLGGEAEKDD